MNKEKILILGLGQSGIKAGILAVAKGYHVIAFDDKKAHEFSKKDIELLNSNLISFTNNIDILNEEYSFIIVSPGINLNEERFKILNNKKVISEIEFAWKFLKGKAIAVTGSNGKSTTVALIEHILNLKNIRAIACGNFGLPLSSVVLDETKDSYVKVVELSSFQLENTNNIEPIVSICLDITENHLNRYDSFKGYELAKLRLFKNNSKNSNWVISKKVTDEHIKLKTYNNLTEIDEFIAEGIFNAHIINNTIIYKNKNIEIKNDALKTECNKSNLLYVLAALSSIINIDSSIENEIESFKSLHYRQEKIYSDENLTIINDSKSSSPDAVSKAICNYKNTKLILILGGRNKKASFKDFVKDFLDEQISIIAYGESKDFFKDLFLGYGKKICVVENLKDAVDSAFKIISDYNVLLFSPGCESFDQFLNYSQRGGYFSELVREKTKK